MSEFTTLVVRGLSAHPRKVVIEGVEHEVLCSSDGHIPAQVDELDHFVNCARAGDLDGMKRKEIRSHAQAVKELSISMRSKGYE
ncbi:hypothetical protein N5D61_24440 [Pseudomonas sp. GD03842]|uniref:hypothetical protein n=1 Tax=Pseudomonas sp. GD03842 TaxID=2975385 RepID=UPI002447B48C|nr:hypothetical protein [Pseudomonas sp. GD03842]MDH0749477.1 hypothetical protein [Pseudomonas sp. GD03842]